MAKVKYPMQKRGQIIEATAIVLITLTTLGIGITALYNSSPLYLGNSETHRYFDYNQCKELLKTIDEKNVVAFTTKFHAENSGFNATDWCV